jgi:hypothetical protein
MAVAVLFGIVACAAAATGIYYSRPQPQPHTAATPLVDQKPSSNNPVPKGPIPVKTQSFLPPPKLAPEARDQQAAAPRQAIPIYPVRAKSSRKKKKLLKKPSGSNAAKAKPSAAK